MLQSIIKPLASLKLTVVLLFLSMILVFAGTCAYSDTDVWTIQKNYFHSPIAKVRFQDLVPRFSDRPVYLHGGFYMPGGYVLGLGLLLNLLAAHAVRWKLRWGDLLLLPLLGLMLGPLLVWQYHGGWTLMWLGVAAGLPLVAAVFWLHGKRGGIILIHLGVALLLVGEGLSSHMQVESRMMIDEGASSNFSENMRASELAFVDHSAADSDTQTVISDDLLKRGGRIDAAELPVVVQVDAYYPHSQLLGPMQGGPNAGRATAGELARLSAAPLKSVAQTEIATPSAYVTLQTRAGENLGTYLVTTTRLDEQTVQVNGRQYGLSLRFERYYKPFHIQLLDFSFDRYPGTNEPRNYSSTVRLVDPRHHEDRQVRIWMNHPLRYDGETYYQASFANNETTTVLQVVRNPAVTVPYVACAVSGLGLAIHFLMMLAGALGRRQHSTVGALSQIKLAGGIGGTGRRYLRPAVLAGSVLVAMLVIWGSWKSTRPGAMNGLADQFGKLALFSSGRLKPFDSVAHHALKGLSGKESFRHDGHAVTAVEWLLDVMAGRDTLAAYRVIRIDDPDVKEALKLDHEQRYFAIRDLQSSGREFMQQVSAIQDVPRDQRSTFQNSIGELADKILLIQQLTDPDMLRIEPPGEGHTQWSSVSEVLAHSGHAGQGAAAGTLTGQPEALRRILAGWGQNDVGEFKDGITQYDAAVAKLAPRDRRLAAFEWFTNRLNLVGRGGPIWTFYLLAFLLAAGSWVIWQRPLRTAAMTLLSIGVLLHLFAVIARVIITGKGPVTNLESSALFVGPVAVILGLAVEVFYRKGLGTALSAVIGFVTLEFYINLTSTSDSMRVIPAVLDTNFWLWTHVPTVAMGYAACLLAGLIGLVYVLMGACTTLLDKQKSRDFARIIYGITCFSILFSFVGTVLGGIWADQSWGRFWGWDPKENGAVLVVLANALLLHARWAGIARDRGIAMLGILGGVVASWSWFGTNQLGKGLHSYGFTSGVATALGAWVLFNVIVLLMASVPQRWWLSAERLRGVPATRRKSAAPMEVGV